MGEDDARGISTNFTAKRNLDSEDHNAGAVEYILKLKTKNLRQEDELRVYVKLAPAGHVGVFPEQMAQWKFILETQNLKLNTKNETPFRILNLFGYTGVASLVAASCGAEVTHVDSSRPVIQWAKENQKISKLENAKIRWIVDDAVSFVKKEIRRGNTYHGIIMDPPVFGRGPKGEIWKFERDLPKLLSLCRSLLAENPIFVIVNAYNEQSSPELLANEFRSIFTGTNGTVQNGILGLQERDSKRILKAGYFARLDLRLKTLN